MEPAAAAEVAMQQEEQAEPANEAVPASEGACGGPVVDNDDPVEICFSQRSRMPSIQVDASLSERLQRLRLNGLSKAVAVDLLRSPPPPSQRRRSRSGLNAALLLAVKEIYSLQDFSSCQLLAKGFFSNVYRVSLERSGRQLALKMNGETHQRSAYREYEIMSKLSHPNVLRYHAVCVHGGRLHCLFDYIEGGSLEQLLADSGRRLGWRLRVGLALDVARAMAYVHGQGYFHRDIASKNILVRWDSGLANAGRPQAVVADFGLAIKMPRYPTQRLECVGSPFWMAPEVMRGGGFSTKADVFSYGIVLCELLTRLPADPDFLPRLSNFGVDAAAIEQLLPPDCPRALLQLCLACCRMDPLTRPSFPDVATALTRLLDKLDARAPLETLSVGPAADPLDDGWRERRQQRCWNPGMKHNPFVTVRWERCKASLASPPAPVSSALLLPTGPELRSPSGLNRSWSYPELSQDLIEFLEIARRCRGGEFGGPATTDDSGVSCVSSSMDTLGDSSFAGWGSAA